MISSQQPVSKMARQIKTIDYDFENDIFFVSNEDKVKASIDIGDFVLDVSHDNLVCGIEIMDASENLGVPKEVLKNVRNMKMSVTYRTNHVYVLLMIVFKKKGKEVNVPIPLTLDLGHKKPRKVEMVYTAYRRGRGDGGSGEAGQRGRLRWFMWGAGFNQFLLLS